MFIILDTQNPSLSDFASWAQVIIAAINLYFVGYLLLHQVKKESQDKNEKEKQSREELRLTWFKELVVQPQLSNFFVFFDNVSSSCDNLKTMGLSDDQKSRVISDLKDHLSLLRKQLVDLLLSVNTDLHNKFRNSLDGLIDDITNDTFSPNVDFTVPSVYSEKIIDRILILKKNLVESIINYRGN